MGLHPLPARDAPRVRRRRGRPVRAPLRELAAVPEERAVGLLLRRRHRRALQRERFAGHAGGRRRLRALRSIAPGPLPGRVAAGLRGTAASALCAAASGSPCRRTRRLWPRVLSRPGTPPRGQRGPSDAAVGPLRERFWPPLTARPRTPHRATRGWGVLVLGGRAGAVSAGVRVRRGRRRGSMRVLVLRRS